jgi:hypothetical protein
MVVRNYDLKTVSKVVTTSPSSLGLGAVPPYMKRWVTFLRLENRFGGQQKLWLVSVATDTYATTPTRASARAKDRFLLQAADRVEVPSSGPLEPGRTLFSIAADKYLNALTSHGSAALFVQYYDAPAGGQS